MVTTNVAIEFEAIKKRLTNGKRGKNVADGKAFSHY